MILPRYGIPEVLRSDSGPQYASKEFEELLMGRNLRTAVPQVTTHLINIHEKYYLPFLRAGSRHACV